MGLVIGCVCELASAKTGLLNGGTGKGQRLALLENGLKVRGSPIETGSAQVVMQRSRGGCSSRLVPFRPHRRRHYNALRSVLEQGRPMALQGPTMAQSAAPE